jgi:hypothetical protein
VSVAFERNLRTIIRKHQRGAASRPVRTEMVQP